MNLIEFLNARLDEREAEANEIHRPAVCRSIDRDGEFDPDPIWCSCDYPARVLRDVEADRKLLAAYAEVAYMDCDDPEPEARLSACALPGSATTRTMTRPGHQAGNTRRHERIHLPPPGRRLAARRTALPPPRPYH